MFAILRGANGRRHEDDFQADPVSVDVSMGAVTVQITMTAADPCVQAKARYVTIALPRDAFFAAMAATSAQKTAEGKAGAARRSGSEAVLPLGSLQSGTIEMV